MSLADIEAVAGAAVCKRAGDGAVRSQLVQMGEVVNGGGKIEISVHGLMGTARPKSGVRAYRGADGGVVGNEEAQGAVGQVHLIEITVFGEILVGGVGGHDDGLMLV